jgi:hypothetical protein
MPAASLRKRFMRHILGHHASIGGAEVTQRAERAFYDALVSTMDDPRRAMGAAHHLSGLREREKAKRRYAMKRLPNR